MWALLVLGLVASIFLAVCTSRCYPKLKEVCTTDSVERARIRSQFQCESVSMLPRRGSAMPHPEKDPVSNTSSDPLVRPGVANSKARPEAQQVSRFAPPCRVIEQRAAHQRRRTSYPRSIIRSSNPHSSENPITERRCSELATIDPSCCPHNAPHRRSRNQQTPQEPSRPRLLNSQTSRQKIWLRLPNVII